MLRVIIIIICLKLVYTYINFNCFASRKIISRSCTALLLVDILLFQIFSTLWIRIIMYILYNQYTKLCLKMQIKRENHSRKIINVYMCTSKHIIHSFAFYLSWIMCHKGCCCWWSGDVSKIFNKVCLPVQSYMHNWWLVDIPFWL